MKNSLKHILLTLLWLFLGTFIQSCNNEEIDPAEVGFQISATIDDQIFIGTDAIDDIEDNQGFVLTAFDGNQSITIGTAWPVDPGTYILGTWDPFINQRFFGSYYNGFAEYYTFEDSGTLTINTIRFENNKVVELTGTFSFFCYSNSNDEVLVSSGRIEYYR